jgi:hypothetical protein
MDFVANQFQASYKNVIDNLVSIHKVSKTDTEFASRAQDTLRTFINNVHLTQSIMFSTIVGNLKYVPVTDQVDNNPVADPAQAKIDLSGLRLRVDTLPNSSTDAKIIHSGTINTIDTDLIVTDQEKSTTNSAVFIPRILNKDKAEPADLISKRQRTIDDWIQSQNTESTATAHSHIPDHYMRYAGPSHYTDYNYDDMDSFVTETSRFTPTQMYGNYPADYYEDPNDFATELDFDEEEELNAELDLHCQDNMCGLKQRLAMDVSQCCARIGRKQIVIDEQCPEYMDNYPPDTYQDRDGFVYGLPCLSTIPIEEFNAGTIFCKDHKTGYEDMRAEPSFHKSLPSDKLARAIQADDDAFIDLI